MTPGGEGRRQGGHRAKQETSLCRTPCRHRTPAGVESTLLGLEMGTLQHAAATTAQVRAVVGHGGAACLCCSSHAG